MRVNEYREVLEAYQLLKAAREIVQGNGGMSTLSPEYKVMLMAENRLFRVITPYEDKGEYMLVAQKGDGSCHE